MITVPRYPLAPDLDISRVVTGLWQVADMERGGKRLDLDASTAAMQSYVAAGLTSFDMADHYGSAEEIAGAYRRRFDPASVQLFTKWVPKPGPMTRKDVRAAVQRSLDRLHADRIDLLQYHAWQYADPVWLDGLFWLDELRSEGLIRHLGLTNTDTAHLRMVVESGIAIVSNQICFSLLDQRAASEMTTLCADRGIAILAFGTIAGGFLTERWLGKPEPDPGSLITWSLMKYKRFVDQAGGWNRFQELLRVVDGVARRSDTSIANVAARYILDQPAVGGVIIGTRLGEREHVSDTLNVFRLALDDESRSALAEAVAALDPIPGDCGDEYRHPPFLTASGDLSHHVDTFPPPYPPQPTSDGRVRIFSGTVWEDLAGFSRAIRIGDRILVSGTTATHGDRLIGGFDPVSQMHFVVDKIEAAIRSFGGTLSDVVRTRIYVNDAADWEAVSRVHGIRFSGIAPANTLIQGGLIGEGYRVEMEAEAVLGSGTTPHNG